MAVRQRARQTPFTEFVLKLNSECNLACTYCYMYESVDPIVRGAARTMSRDTTRHVGRRIAEHATAHGSTRLRVVLHGGEPLMGGADGVAWIAAELRRQVEPEAHIEFSMQTNGVLITESVLETMRGAGVRIGVSLDGSRAANDRHRLFRDGRSSYPRVVRALEMLQRYPDLYAGILAVVDLDGDPVETYEALLAYAPPVIDLLLPHGNWENRPPGRPADDSTPYGDWLVKIFDRWYSASTKEVGIRIFEEIINGILGGSSRSESIGLSPAGMIVVDSDGAMEQVDTLRSTFVGARETGLNVFDHPFDVALSHEVVVARQSGESALSSICLECPVHRVCGGGYFPHRYSAANGFRNPSVYCADLSFLIDHVARRVHEDIGRVTDQVSP